MRVTSLFLFTLFAFASSQIVPLSDNSTVSSFVQSTTASQEDSNITFTDLSLNLSSLDTTTNDELGNCLSLLNDSNIFLETFELAAAVQRTYSDGYKQYYLYFDVNDTDGNIHQFQSVVSMNNNAYPVYTLENMTDLSATNVFFNTTSNESVTQPIVTQTVLTASSLSKLYDSIAQGFTQLSQSDIKADSNFASLEADLSKGYPAVSNTQQEAVYSKSIGLVTSYIAFYSKSSGEVYSLFGVVDNVRKAHYIISVNQVNTSSVKGK